MLHDGVLNRFRPVLLFRFCLSSWMSLTSGACMCHSAPYLWSSATLTNRCFFLLQDLGPRLFAGQDEAPGCEQLCSKFIYDRINNFTTDEKVLCVYVYIYMYVCIYIYIYIYIYTYIEYL
jgi:hypothetical protein